jgi:CTP:phosphocholine cytidylyltransferase-like protein
MSNKKIIFIMVILFAVVSPCFLSISPVNSRVEVDDDQINTNITILSPPKSSGYAVTKRWNHTTVGSVTCVAVSADGGYMAVATEDNLATGETLFFYNTSNHDGRPMWSYQAPTNWSSLAISEDGSYIVAGTQVDQRAVLFNSTIPKAGPKKEVWMVDLNDNVYSVDISADGKLIVVGGDSPTSSDGIIRLYNNSYSSNKVDEYLWTCHPDNHVVSVAISSDGKYVVAGTNYTASTIGQIIFLNTTDTDGTPMWWDNTGCNITSVAISKYGDYYVAGTVNRSSGSEVIVLSKAAKGGYIWGSDRGNSQDITSVVISEDGEYIATGGSANSGSGGYIALYNNSGVGVVEPMWEYITNEAVNSVDITKKGNYILAGTGYSQSTGDIDENTIFLFNKSADGVKQPEWYFNTSDNVNSVSISEHGRYIGAGGMSTSGEVYLFYHAIPIPPLPRSGDDDDDDEGFDMRIVVLIIVLAGVGAGVVVMVVLIKKRR